MKHVPGGEDIKAKHQSTNCGFCTVHLHSGNATYNLFMARIVDA